MLNIVAKNKTFYFLYLPALVLGMLILHMASVVFLLAGVVLFTVKKRYDLIIITFLIILIFSDNVDPSFEFTKFFRVLILLYSVFLSVSIISFHEKGFDVRILYFLPFFIIGFISSYAFSPDLSASIVRDISYFMVVITIFTFFRYTYENQRQELFENLIVIFLLVFGISMLGVVPPFKAAFYMQGRLRGVMGNPNGLALLCIMSFPIVDYLSANKSYSLPQAGLKLLKILIILCLVLTGSRNGVMSVMIYILARLFFTYGVSAKVLSLIGIVGIVVIAMNYKTIIRDVPALAKYSRSETLNDASGRTDVWNVAIQEIKRNPWIGNGNYYYNIYFANYAEFYGLVARQWFGVWNSYLAFLLDSGIIGLLSYLFFLFGLIKYGGNLRWILPFLAAALFSAIFESWLVASLNVSTPMFLFYFIITQNNRSNEDLSVV